MLLSDRFITHKNKFDEFKNYSVRKVEINNIYTVVYLESKENTVRLDIEEMESYVSFLISHNTSNGVVHFYGLSDYCHYSDYPGEKRSVFETKEEERAFKNEINNCIKRHNILIPMDKKHEKLIYIIYSYLEKFIRKLRSTG